jgi:alpha-L-rhamnosidase
MHIKNPRCCLQTNPLGIDRLRPELSWELCDPSPGSSRQTAYRISVASCADGLDQPDLWDSGRVESDRTSFIIYDGQPLASRMECHWRVEVWDESGRNIRSEAARWSMGLLESSDWSARWVGLDAAAEYPQPWFGAAQWIWSKETDPGTWEFRREFDLTPSQMPELSGARFHVLAEDEAEVFLNDEPLCRAPRARAGTNLYPAPLPTWIEPRRLRAGRNELRIMASKRAGGDESVVAIDAAGLIVRLTLLAHGEKPGREIVTNAGWACRSLDGRQTEVVELGAYGVPPWHMVTPQEYPNLPARYLRREVVLPAAPRRAVLYFSGLGLGEAYINGKRVGDEVLAPLPTDYDARVFYRTHEVTHLLREGRNALAAVLGNGRFFAPRLRVPWLMRDYGCPKMLWQLEVEMDDGSTITLASSPEWKITTAGPIGWNNEFDGETFDARVDFEGWSEPGFSDATWEQARLVASPGGVMESQMAEPMRVVRRIKAVESWTTKYGTTIHDFGENVAGWCHVRLAGEPGARARFLHAESLDGRDALFLDNLRSALCCDTVTTRGGLLDYEPRFTIHGFRYVEVLTELAAVVVESIEVCVVHDDVRLTADFVCSDPVINGVLTAARRGILGNYRGMPTDCPQRDERMGWLGDRSTGAAGEMILFDVAAFYRKWVADIRAAQNPNGRVPDIAPPFWAMYSDNVTWPSCVSFIPHWLLRYYGDEPGAVRNLPALKRWITHILGLRHDGLIERDTYGDWCVPPEESHLIHTKIEERKTPAPLLSSCYAVEILRQGSRFAELAGELELARQWRDEARTMSEAINRRYFHEAKGFYANGSQTSSLLPLAFGIVPEEHRTRVFEHIVSGILQSGEPVIGTGLIGTGWLMRTLTTHGRGDLACAIAMRTKYPSWGYMLENGATTIWELWNGNTADPAMNSGNHVMLLGDLLPWLFEDLAGIQPAEPGFRRILLKPFFPAALEFVEASVHAMPGEIRSGWKRGENGMIEWTFTVPANTTATVVLPAQPQPPEAPGARDAVSSSGQWTAVFDPGAHAVRLAAPPLVP